MIGPRGIAETLAAHLTAHLTDEVDRLEHELGPVVDPGDVAALPELSARPHLIGSTQLPVLGVGLDDWPFVIVIVRRMSRQRRVDISEDGVVAYERDYPTRVFGFARGDGYHATAAVRDRLILAISETLLRHHSFGAPGQVMRILGNELVEEYSDVAPETDAENADTIGAAYVEVPVRVHELVTPVLPPFGPITEVGIDTPPLSRHPALE